MYHKRGQAYETLGEFDRARGDYERALDAAHTAFDGSLEWQSMMALGFLWTERDYTQAGAWFRRASDLAERLADPTLRARSLNRLGNWLLNTGRSEEGLQAHQEALRIFEEQQNTQGMAETLDLLGITYGMRGDRVKAVEQLGQAIALFRTLGDTQSLISSLAMRAVQSLPGSSETTFCPLRTRNECVQDAGEALRLARQIDWLAGQAFAENALAHTLLSFGEFSPALS
ncbi:MAG TPA: tetratricopeptide repeat protein, partial [Ktedonobacteraceae bacterium]